ncbi:MAG: hypothetical protein OQK12_13175 [Motiliproteus sp.]|nr:hypothetical protein [Motiliproteus sp.]MCW9051778.1 hypothetical protein [Motiliproteus sp.]
MTVFRHRFIILNITLASVLGGCGFFYPQEVEFYDPECQIIAKKYVLESVGVSGIGVSCQNEGCLIAMIPAAASAVVSGSIVVVGNVIHWLEKQGRCQRTD